MGARLKHHLGAINFGAENGAKLSANNLGAACRQRGPDLGARIYCAETCKLGATNDDAELRVQILKAYL